MTGAARGAAQALGHNFAEPAILQQALTHASAQDGKPGLAINERLEFLGDRVLGLVVASRLYKDFPMEGENGLAPRFNAVVNRSACARVARGLGLGAWIQMSPAEERSGGRDKEAILADACEAVIAAIYLDGGFAAAEAFVLTAFASELAGVIHAPRDPKTVLQEWAAAQRFSPPRYVVVARSGPDHAPLFVIEAHAPPAASARGEGTSKRDAERAAARALLEQAGIDV
jgi:ribonuclease-3